MRIISGKLKRKSIDFLKTKVTRPLKDSVKENIFNILTHSNEIKVQVKNANVLDVYSGIGSFGIECISREADFVTFVENDFKALQILKKNLVRLAITHQTKVMNDKFENIKNWKKKNKYDIFFFDPPFKDYGFLKNLEIIKKNKIFKKNHILIIHREKKSEENYKDLIKILIKKKYGRSKIIFGIFN
ncbi:16S rRNA (guanine(966)-N(2))-methyltransferase RsmD [Pelagibacteraceae bacterium]|nr:16S rRNA (guanine(966)-N(2))-methyltransferase RsmD [Pelagibacteraceae bacterium]